MAAFRLRNAKADDCDDVMQMVREFGEFLKLPEPATEAADLKRDGFGDNPWFHIVVAELTSGSEEGRRRPLAGYVLYYYTFDPFKGRGCYMEHLYVREKWRDLGIGSALWATLTERAIARDCQYVIWMATDWNHPALQFYQAKGAYSLTQQDGSLFFQMVRPTMESFVAKTFPKGALSLEETT